MEEGTSMDEKKSKMMKRAGTPELSTTQKMMAMKYISKKYFLIHRISSWPLQI
jgi:hypothetical protein